MIRRYLLVDAAAFRLLIDATLVTGVAEAPDGGDAAMVDVSRALGGGDARLVVACVIEGAATRIGVDAAVGLFSLAADAFAPLPGLIAAASGQDIDAVTRRPVEGAHAFRLLLDRSSAAAAA